MSSGLFLGGATLAYVFWLNWPLDQQADQIIAAYNRRMLELEGSGAGTFTKEISAQIRDAGLQNLSRLKEFVTLFVSIFGAGVSGGLIVAAIIEKRKNDVSSSTDSRRAERNGAAPQETDSADELDE